MLTYILFFIGFVFLIKGADFLVNGASSVARRLKISDLVIGLTIVAFGTSAPELFVNLFAAFRGTTDIAMGNIIGSNIANVMLILGIAAIIYPLKVTKGTTWKEIPLSLLAVALLIVMANDTLIDGFGFNQITASEGLVLMAFFIIFLYYTFGIAKAQGIDTLPPAKQYSTLKSVGFIVLGLIGLAIGGQFIVHGAVAIALSLGLSETLIGLTIVAIGTSLPELATSAVAAYKKNADIAVGNIVGSNIFNIFWILGMSAVINPLPFSNLLMRDVLMTVIATLLLFLFMFVGKKHHLERWQGVLFILIYIIYILVIIFQ